MDNYIDQFVDLLAEFNMDVYDEKELSDGKYRFDILIVEKDINELIARLRVTNAVDKINKLWKIHDRGLTLESIRVNETADREFNFSIVVKFFETKKDEPAAEKTVTDAIDGTITESEERHGFDYGPYETLVEVEDIEIISDGNGKKLDFGDAYIRYDKPYNGTHYTVLSKEEVMDLYSELSNQRNVDGKLIDDFDMVDGEYTKEFFEENFDDFANAIDFKVLDEDEAGDIVYKQSL